MVLLKLDLYRTEFADQDVESKDVVVRNLLTRDWEEGKAMVVGRIVYAMFEGYGTIEELSTGVFLFAIRGKPGVTLPDPRVSAVGKNSEDYEVIMSLFGM